MRQSRRLARWLLCPALSMQQLQALRSRDRPRFQPPLINPDMRFSRIRLSEILHRAAIGAALCHVTVPDS